MSTGQVGHSDSDLIYVKGEISDWTGKSMCTSVGTVVQGQAGRQGHGRVEAGHGSQADDHLAEGSRSPTGSFVVGAGTGS